MFIAGTEAIDGTGVTWQWSGGPADRDCLLGPRPRQYHLQQLCRC